MNRITHKCPPYYNTEIKKYFFFILTALIFTCSYSQVEIREENSNILTHYNSENSSIQNTVCSIVKDYNGFIWLSTEGGVFRWDGNFFYPYSETLKGKYKLQRILASAINRKDSSIYFLKSDDSVYILNKKNQLTKSSLLGETDIGFNVSGFYYIRNEKEKHQHRLDGFCIYPNKNGYINYHLDTIYFFNKKESTLKKVCVHQKNKETFFLNDTLYLCLNLNKQLALINGKCENKHFIFIKDGKKLTGAEFRNLKILQYQNIKYIASISGNIYSFKKKSDTVFLNFQYSLKTPNIRCYYFDEENNEEYFGTSDDGFYRIRKNQFKSLKVLNSDNKNPIIYSQLPLLNGDIVCEDYSFFLKELKSKNVVFSSFQHNSKYFADTVNKIPCPMVSFKYFNYCFLIGTRDKGLYLFNQKDYSVKKIMQFDAYISGIINYDNENIIVSTFKQIFKINLISQITTCIYQGHEQPNILTIHLADKNTLWIGRESGLFKLELSKNQLKETCLLNNIYIRNITKVENNSPTILLSTYGNGIYAYYKNNFIKLPIDKNAFLNYAHCFALDKTNRFWIPTNNGLFVIAKDNVLNYLSGKKNNLSYFHFDKNDGILFNEFNGGTQPNYIETKDGRFSFPTLKGLVTFNPNNIKIKEPLNPLIIEEIYIDSTTSISPKSKIIELGCDYKFLTIKVAQSYIGNQNNKTIVYKLNNYDEKFNELSGNGLIKYNSLPGGTYELEIKNINFQNKSNNNSIKIKLIVDPKWYNTIWFYVVLILLSVIFGWISVRARTKVLLKNKLKLEIIVDEKTFHLNRVISELKESNKQSDILTTVLSHDIRGPLKLMIEINKNLLRNWQIIEDENKKYYLSESLNSMETIYHFMIDILVWIKVKKNKVVNPERITVSTLIKKLESDISFLEKKSNSFEFINHTKEDSSFLSNQKIIEIVLYNILSNANKYTEEGIIRITIKSDTTKIYFACEDNGVGMTQINIDSILQKKFDEIPNYNDSFKLGYILILDLLEIIEGEISISSIIGKGTTVTVIIPINHTNKVDL